jgi:hypothetical protein
MASRSIFGFPPYNIAISANDIHSEKSGVSIAGFAHADIIRENVRTFTIGWHGSFDDMNAVYLLAQSKMTITGFDFLDGAEAYKKSVQIRSAGWNADTIIYEVTAVYQEL